MICCCCGAYVPRNGKPQDPDRDRGFGWCLGCKHYAIEDWMKDDGNVSDKKLSAEKAEARWQKYYGQPETTPTRATTPAGSAEHSRCG